MHSQHIHFVTGRLAESALRRTVQRIASSLGFDFTIEVLPITVAALMTPRWVAKRVHIPKHATRLLLPGYCSGDLTDLESMTPARVERGPRDLRQLPRFFGQQEVPLEDYGDYNIEIIAEINHAPRLHVDTILRIAAQYQAAGADVIDVGCEPGDPWTGVGECVRALREAGHRVSIDSFQTAEIEAAVAAGAELVLSVNASNRQAATTWGCEVVAIPDEPSTMKGLDETVDCLASASIPFRLDPILEPIGCGFAESLQRYTSVRQRYPQAKMMMGIGNLTELTDVDSAGINLLLLGFCQELGIKSVLTTQVINWARTSVGECDVARRLTHFAVHQQRPPKHIDARLVMLRDPRVEHLDSRQLEELAERIRDPNYRVFLGDGRFHLVGAQLHLSSTDPFDLFDLLQATDPKRMDASHAFYLGFELSKATTARTLGKTYEQDSALTWGLLTDPEERRHGSHGSSET